MNIDMIDAAARRLEGHARRTPLLSSPFLDEIAGRRVLVKPECLQHTGSFKFRGGWSAVSALTPEIRARGVIAFSSGNHAQGVALAARMHGVPAVIIMPADAPAAEDRQHPRARRRGRALRPRGARTATPSAPASPPNAA